MFPFKNDPGPCPVDDTPHTACTPESVGRTFSVTVQPPRALVALQAAAGARSSPAAPVPPVERVAVQDARVEGPEDSTKTYRRRKKKP